MSGPGETNSLVDRHRRWAGAQLDVSADAPPEAIRSRILEYLQEVDLVPSLRASEAIDVLTGRPTEARWFHEHLQVELQEPVETFCQRFFDIPPADRIRLWEVLCRECQPFPQLRGRLRRLAPGLNVERPTAAGDSDDVRALAQTLCEWFARSPLEQVPFRRRARERMTSDPARWQTAARKLAKRHADFSELDPEFVATLANMARRDRLERWKQCWKKFDLAVERSAARFETRAGAVGIATGFVIAVAIFKFMVLGFQPKNEPPPSAHQQSAALEPRPTSSEETDP